MVNGKSTGKAVLRLNFCVGFDIEGSTDGDVADTVGASDGNDD